MVTNPAINPATPYDPVKDFAHVSNVAATPNVIAVHPSVPAKDYKVFFDLLQKNPGKYSFGTAGNGTVGHLLVELYKSTAKVYVTSIPYQGSGPALNDVVAGQLPIIVDNLPSALPFIKDKRLIAIVVAAPSRLASLPDVPTFAEVGLAPVNRMSFLGVSAPKGTPKDYRHDSKPKVMRLPVAEFTRRFLLHVLDVHKGRACFERTTAVAVQISKDRHL